MMVITSDMWPCWGKQCICETTLRAKSVRHILTSSFITTLDNQLNPSTLYEAKKDEEQQQWPSIYRMLSDDIQKVPAQVWKAMSWGALPFASQSVCDLLVLDRHRVEDCMIVGVAPCITIVLNAISDEMLVREIQKAAANEQDGGEQVMERRDIKPTGRHTRMSGRCRAWCFKQEHTGAGLGDAKVKGAMV